jgi:hypothetical protein
MLTQIDAVLGEMWLVKASLLIVAGHVDDFRILQIGNMAPLIWTEWPHLYPCAIGVDIKQVWNALAKDTSVGFEERFYRFLGDMIEANQILGPPPSAWRITADDCVQTLPM